MLHVPHKMPYDRKRRLTICHSWSWRVHFQHTAFILNFHPTTTLFPTVSRGPIVAHNPLFEFKTPHISKFSWSWVYLYLYYCACIWGLTYHSNLKRLVTIQKRAVRTISRSAFDAHTDPIFKSLKLLKFENIVSLQVAIIMYLYKSGQLPESFQNMFFTGQEIHNYNTRNRSFFRLPSCRTKCTKILPTISRTQNF